MQATMKDMRAWAKQNGIKVPTRGVLSREVADLYNIAHSSLADDGLDQDANEDGLSSSDLEPIAKPGKADVRIKALEKRVSALEQLALRRLLKAHG